MQVDGQDDQGEEVVDKSTEAVGQDDQGEEVVDKSTEAVPNVLAMADEPAEEDFFLKSSILQLENPFRMATQSEGQAKAHR